MLYDRDYMREGEGPNFRSPVLQLLVALVFLFLFECFLKVYAGAPTLADWFGLNYAGMARHEYYRLVTFQFIHDAPWPWHMLMNGIGLWFFGRGILETQGTRRFWLLYLIAGLGGGLLDLACQAWHLRYPTAGTIGASGNILGLAGAFCMLNPGREIVFFLYVIPIRMRAITMFWLLFGYSVFGVVFPHGGISHAAHLGGLLAGVGFAKLVSEDRAADWLRQWRKARPSRPPEVPVVAGKHGAPPKKPKPVGNDTAPLSPEDFMQREVDPILDKILAHGPQSLTERERRILEQAPKRLGRKLPE